MVSIVLPHNLQRLLAPRSIALIGASAWTDAVAAGVSAIGFSGEVWRIHPTRPSTDMTPFYRSVAELPDAPDAAFVAVPNTETASVAKALAMRGAGGFVCFTAGFSETGTDNGRQLTRDLGIAAGSMPYFGPNCYGFANFFDRVALWPDQVVGTPIERGVAIICQSGTIALTLMFNARSMPIGYLITVGNQTRLAVEDLIENLCADPRVSAFGLYLEGIKDTERFAHAAEGARKAGKPIVLVKAGRSEAAARTAHSHTGALAGADSVFDAFCRSAGIARCDTLGTLCETLKVLHARGPLAGRKVLIMGASGGDMAMAADVSQSLQLEFPAIAAPQAAVLQKLLTDRVTIANPFDIHTYLWFDPPALGKVFSEVLHAGYDAVGFMLDCPPELLADTEAFDAVIDVYIKSANQAPTCAALISSLPETLNARTRQRCFEGKVVPLQGLREALEALDLAGDIGTRWLSGVNLKLQRPASVPDAVNKAYTLSEVQGKAAVAAFGVSIPRGNTCPVEPSGSRVVSIAQSLGFPLVIKAVGAHLEHKTEVGGVIVNVRTAADAVRAVIQLSKLSDIVLVEEMIIDAVAEILIGITVDPQFGQVLVLGAGGVLAEILNDSITLLPPWTSQTIEAALSRLSVSKLLRGYRGKPAGDVPALVGMIKSVADYASAHVENLVELDVNPAMVRPMGLGAVAVDVLIRLKPGLTTRS